MVSPSSLRSVASILIPNFVLNNNSRHMFNVGAFAFYKGLRVPKGIPPGIDVLNPYQHSDVLLAVEQFLQTYFQDTTTRVGVFGINPGRLGAGLTGVSFTDPVALRENCGISTTLDGRRELSSEFIYKMIDAFGGPRAFYSSFFLSSICPLGFVRNDKNINYYDDAELCRAAMPFIHSSMKKQLDLPLRRDVAVILGTGTLKRSVEMINATGGYFERLVFLEHPRYIMQYKRSSIATYIDSYISTLTSVSSFL